MSSGNTRKVTPCMWLNGIGVAILGHGRYGVLSPMTEEVVYSGRSADECFDFIRAHDGPELDQYAEMIAMDGRDML